MTTTTGCRFSRRRANLAAPSKAALCEKAVFGARQAEVFAKGLAFVVAAEQPTALDFRYDAVDKVVEPSRYIREHDVESVPGCAIEPFLHLVGDHRGRTHQGEPAIAAGDPCQI